LDDHAPPVSPADDQRARTAVQICDKARAAERDKGTR
jgi:hypothetical protein